MFLLLVAFPPWCEHDIERRHSLGWHPLWAPPEKVHPSLTKAEQERIYLNFNYIPDDLKGKVYGEIDFVVLCAELTAGALGSLSLRWFLKRREDP